MKPMITPRSELQSLPANDWCDTWYGIAKCFLCFLFKCEYYFLLLFWVDYTYT